MKKDISIFLKVKANSPFMIRPNRIAVCHIRHQVISACIEQIEEPEKYIPEFQRSNDKWTKKMQVKFIENLITGCVTQISLYTTTDKEFPKWFILDGLQRLTAFNLFITNQLKVFGDLTYDDVKDNISGETNPIEFKLYRFNNEIEAVEFYIAINENITHSKKDIQRAKDYLDKLKGF
ncbi:DUF262 domain-containing protein [Aliarcobacter butzleri]|uniref:DUF262 domain-containing protein n=1 Tax=Aliarcobacter butzleri TaxID=28197 RepID=UPI00126A0117|nr:DUF262 domain-containing protein [Aliarcobacter butzleri]